MSDKRKSTRPAALDEGLVTGILAAVDASFGDQVAFTQDLVRYPSLRGQEHSAQAFVYESLAEREYAMDRWSIDVAEIEAHPGFSPVAVNYERLDAP